MVHRLIEEHWYKVYGVKIIIGIYDGIATGDPESFKRTEREHVGGNELPVIHLAVIGSVGIGHPV